MLIGESAKKLSEETRKKIDLPWKQIIGFRHMAIHDYINLKLYKYPYFKPHIGYIKNRKECLTVETEYDIL